MLVDKITIEIFVNQYDLIAKNYKTIEEGVCKEVDRRYNANYNYGVEYYYDYKVVNLQQQQLNHYIARAMVCLLIYKDEEKAMLIKECGERLEGGI